MAAPTAHEAEYTALMPPVRPMPKGIIFSKTKPLEQKNPKNAANKCLNTANKMSVKLRDIACVSFFATSFIKKSPPK